MKKQEVIDLMMKNGNKDKFHHIKMAEPKQRKAPAKREKKEKAKKQKEGDDFALQKAEDISMDTIIITPKKRKRKPKAKKETHKMPDGTVMTGKKHTAKSKPYLTATKQDGTVVELKRKAKKVEPKINFKNELYNILNKYYELLNKIELKVLNKKIKDDSKEYYNQQADVEDIINEKLSRLLKKYKINLYGLDDTTEFFSRSMSPISKPLYNLNMDKINFKQIPNYKKFQNTGDKIEKSK